MQRILIAAVLAAFVSAPAASQNAEPKVPGDEQVAPRLDQKACRDGDRLRQGDTVENDGVAPREQEDASDKLARTEGVICPAPEHDPDIRAPAPQNGSNMPVIPPPGSPGGDPAVRPK
jgi:hypothetical protein